jgi:hypothetical protein
MQKHAFPHRHVATGPENAQVLRAAGTTAAISARINASESLLSDDNGHGASLAISPR